MSHKEQSMEKGVLIQVGFISKLCHFQNLWSLLSIRSSLLHDSPAVTSYEYFSRIPRREQPWAPCHMKWQNRRSCTDMQSQIHLHHLVHHLLESMILMWISSRTPSHQQDLGSSYRTRRKLPHKHPWGPSLHTDMDLVRLLDLNLYGGHTTSIDSL